MNAHFFFSEIFWGLLLVLFGASIIIKAVFGIDIPIVRTFIAIILIYIGITIISNAATGSSKHRQTITFEERSIKPAELAEHYTISFAKGIIDLRSIEIPHPPKTITISTTFGTTILKIDKSMPIVLRINTSFGSAHLPNDTITSFGEYVYKTQPHTDKPELIIHAQVTFGTLEVLAS